MRLRTVLSIAGLAFCLWSTQPQAGGAFVDYGSRIARVNRPIFCQERPERLGYIHSVRGAGRSEACSANGRPTRSTARDNLLVFRNGTWFINFAGDGAAVDCQRPVRSRAPTSRSCGCYGNCALRGDLALFRNGLWFLNASHLANSSRLAWAVTSAVHIGAKGFGNLTTRQNMIYGVYRVRAPGLSTKPAPGAPTRTVNFGGLDSGCFRS